MKRPLLSVGLLFCAGILTGDWIALPVGRPLCAAAGVWVLSLLWPSQRARLLYPLVFLAGWGCLNLQTAVISSHDLRQIIRDGPALVTVRGRLIKTPSLRVRETPAEPI